MKIAIRDDDLCYYSRYEDFRSVYDPLGIPVSASVVPFAVPNHGDSFPWGDYPKNQPRAISENRELVEAARADIEAHRLEILQHGYSHEYKREGNLWIPEMMWKDKKRLCEEIAQGKEELEKTFYQPIRVFVAPSQEIGKDGIKAIEKSHLHFSGCPSRLGLRPFGRKRLINIAIRHFNRFRFGLPIGRFAYPRHIEVSTAPLRDLNEMKRVFDICKKHDYALVVVVHYWKLLKNPADLARLNDFADFVRSQNEEFSFVGDCY